MKTKRTISKQSVVKEFYNDGVLVGMNIKNEITSIQNEPPFIKLYLQDLSRLHGLGAGTSSILYELVQLIDYKNSQ